MPTRKTTEQFIDEAIKIHGNLYDYSYVKYINTHEHAKIICNCGFEFYQAPVHHLHGSGCPKCSGKMRKTTEEFILEAKSIRGDKYDYSDVNYVRTNVNVVIKCETHGNFLQTPSSHLIGSGCPSCKSSRGENKIKRILKNLGIVFTPQYKDATCRYKNILRFDFYVFDIVDWILEFQGEQHYKISHFSSDYDTNVSNYEYIKIRDNIKRKWCLDNNIPLLEIHYKDKNIEKTISDFRDNLERMK